jgi:hypothetical protein
MFIAYFIVPAYLTLETEEKQRKTLSQDGQSPGGCENRQLIEQHSLKHGSWHSLDIGSYSVYVVAIHVSNLWGFL